MGAITQFLQQNTNTGASRFYMPGHKGVFYDQTLRLDMDITEIIGADALYEANGIIGQSEAFTAQLYGATVSAYSAGGATLCIQAMLALVAKAGSRVIATRNAHTAFLNTCVLLDLLPVWLCGDTDAQTGLCLPVTAKQVEQALCQHPDSACVYVTSPDYYGQLCDLEAIAAVCHRYHKPLLVDNAHGAHLKFMPQDLHPMTLGADLCCDSFHKTLPALTGAAVLHSRMPYTKQQIKKAMALFGSTSPSYLILASIEQASEYAKQSGASDFAALSRQVSALQQQARRCGFSVLSNVHDTARLTLGYAPLGLDRQTVYALLQAHRIEVEYLSDRHIVCLCAPFQPQTDFDRLHAFLTACQAQRTPVTLARQLPYTVPMRAMRPRDAALADGAVICCDQAAGKISAETVITCPPGVPIVAAGEIIDQTVGYFLKKSGIFSIKVVL